ncbi:MAG: hypothetical protein ACI9HK_001507 [Pirellulaceae bacterium]|jgi:hypothetical protein
MKHRGLLSMAALLSVAIVGGIVGWAMWSTSLPHPTAASREQIMQWLVLRELPAEPEEISVALVDRIQAEIGTGIDTAGSTELSTAYKQQLSANIDHLEEVWFRTRCRQYEELPRDNRLAFIIEQIDFLLLWSELDSELHKNEVPEQQRFEFTKEFFDNVAAWVANAEGQPAQRMEQGLQDSVVGWLAAFDLSSEPPATQLELANRIVEQLDSGLQLTDVHFDLNEQHNVQLQQNIELLLQQWTYDLAERYDALAPPGRKLLLEEKVTNITQWKIGSLLAGNAAAAKAKNNPMALLANVEKWAATAPKSKQLKVQRLVNDVKQVMLFKFLGGLLSPK